MAFSVPSDVPFDRVFSRMTAQECGFVMAYVSAGAITTNLPTHLMGEGALTHWFYNGGNGSYFSTSPYRYAGGIFNANMSAFEARAALKTQYEADPTNFVQLAAGLKIPRAYALIADEPPVPPGAASPKSEIFFWSSGALATDFEYGRLAKQFEQVNERGNLLRYVDVFYQSNGSLPSVSTIATQLAALPAGQRTIRLSGFRPLWAVPGSDTSSGRWAMYSRQFDHPTRWGLSLVPWRDWMVNTSNKWYQFWDTLLTQGGVEILDKVRIDVEVRPRFWELRGGVGSKDNLSDIFNDDEWDAGENLISKIKPVLSQAVWNTYATWDMHRDERAFLFDAFLRADYTAKWAEVLAIPFAKFPQLALDWFDYDSGLHCAGTRQSISAPSYSMCPVSASGHVGGSSTSNYTLDGAQWKWSARDAISLSSLVGDEKAWVTFLQHDALVESQRAATTLPQEVWLAYESYNLDIGTKGLEREKVLHSILDDRSLSGARRHISFYNSQDSFAQSNISASLQKLFVDLVAERDQVVGYEGAVAEILPPDVSFDQAYKARRVWAGWRWVWRVTPNPALPPTKITEGAEDLEFRFGNDAKLFIPRGRIVRVAETQAPLGWWVIQRPDPRSLLRCWSVPVGTKAVPLCPAPTKDWCKRIIVRAALANTALVYLGSSSSVNGTNGNANCGWPLEPGEERTFPVLRSIDGGDETTLFGIAASGNQSCHVEAL